MEVTDSHDGGDGDSGDDDDVIGGSAAGRGKKFTFDSPAMAGNDMEEIMRTPNTRGGVQGGSIDAVCSLVCHIHVPPASSMSCRCRWQGGWRQRSGARTSVHA